MAKTASPAQRQPFKSAAFQNQTTQHDSDLVQILEGKCLMAQIGGHADWANICLGDDAMAADIQAALDCIYREPYTLRSGCVA